MIKTFTLGSLFDGSGGFPLAGALCGVEPRWASEVEPYPIAVTRSRLPNMKHLGDISKVNGAELDPVDIITFGSPCQDLSVAGKRAGLKHEANGDEETTRSGLFMEAVRIIKEMRKATGGESPRFALWENVPGAFSSQKGEDFRVVLEELIRIVEPGAVMPPVPKAGWAYADSYIGDGWSLAYRVFDAQYWGVPQRRRRIHLVLDLRGERAREILFEREGVRGYFAEGRTPWQAAPADAQGCTGADDREGKRPGNIGFAAGWPLGFRPENVRMYNEVATTVCNGTRPGFCNGVLVYDARGNGEGGHIYEGVSGTLRAEPGDNRMAVAYSIENHPADSRVSIDESGKVQTLTSRMDTGGGNVPMVMEQKRAYCMGNGQMNQMTMAEQSNTLDCMHDQQAVVYGVDVRNGREHLELFGTLQAKPNGGQSLNFSGAVRIRYIVRRLTPTECARLQGFADCWGHIDQKDGFTPEEYRFWMEVRNTHAAINNKPVKEYTEKQMLTWYNKLHTDSAEYKMWGNGIALPPALYCMQGIVDVLEGKAS